MNSGPQWGAIKQNRLGCETTAPCVMAGEYPTLHETPQPTKSKQPTRIGLCCPHEKLQLTVARQHGLRRPRHNAGHCHRNEDRHTPNFSLNQCTRRYFCSNNQPVEDPTQRAPNALPTTPIACAAMANVDCAVSHLPCPSARQCGPGLGSSHRYELTCPFDLLTRRNVRPDAFSQHLSQSQCDAASTVRRCWPRRDPRTPHR